MITLLFSSCLLQALNGIYRSMQLPNTPRTRYMFFHGIIQTYVRTFEEKVSLEPEKNTREFLEVKIFKRNQ